MLLPEDEEVIEALALDRLHEPRDHSVPARGPGASAGTVIVLQDPEAAPVDLGLIAPITPQDEA